MIAAPPLGVSERYSRDGVYDLAGSLAEWVIDVPPPTGLGCTSGCYPKAPSVGETERRRRAAAAT